MSARAKPDLIIDCDPGHDDALALLLAGRFANLIGVTTVSGNAPLANVTENARRVLALAGLDVPVHAGAAGPLRMPADGVVPHALHALHVHGPDGLGGVPLPEPMRPLASEDAVGYLLDAARTHDDLWLVAIGPLTNVALALAEDPAFARRLAGISIMGGSTAGGNVTATAEFNVWADPEAADRVFRSGAAIRLCGLNLTHQLKTSADTIARLDGLATPRAECAGRIVRYLHERMRALTGEAAAALHDPCAVLAVTHPALFDFRSRPIAVELEGALTRGMTVVDERFSGRLATPQVEVAYRIDAGAAFERLFEALG